MNMPQQTPNARAQRRRAVRHKLCLGAAGSAFVGALLLLRPTDVGATPPAPVATGSTEAQSPTAAPSQAAPTAAPVSSTAVPSTAQPPATTVQPTPTTATIIFATTPAVTAIVTWGKKLLGKITPGKPLVVVRPRDSGPLDVVVRAKGYLAVQTRAHTFSDNRVQVKLTAPDKKNELLGYRAPLDAGVEQPEETALLGPGGGDAGVVAPPATFQMVPTTPPMQGPLLAP
jgi:hypothetical protein